MKKKISKLTTDSSSWSLTWFQFNRENLEFEIPGQGIVPANTVPAWYSDTWRVTISDRLIRRVTRSTHVNAHTWQDTDSVTEAMQLSLSPTTREYNHSVGWLKFEISLRCSVSCFEMTHSCLVWRVQRETLRVLPRELHTFPPPDILLHFQRLYVLSPCGPPNQRVNFDLALLANEQSFEIGRLARISAAIHCHYPMWNYKLRLLCFASNFEVSLLESRVVLCLPLLFLTFPIQTVN